MWFPNPNRIREIFTEESVKRAADVVLSYQSRRVFFAVVYLWALILGMAFTLIVTVRLALSIPLL